jgi:hypothetical protein
MSNLSPADEALLDLPLDTCLWPRGEDEWCGRPTLRGRPYCIRHCRKSRAAVQRDSLTADDKSRAPCHKRPEHQGRR